MKNGEEESRATLLELAEQNKKASFIMDTMRREMETVIKKNREL